MNLQSIRLGPGECPDIESGARFFAALAFSHPAEAQARNNAIAAWVASYLRKVNQVDGCVEPFEDFRLNRFTGLSPTWCQATLRTAMRRLRDRSACARAVRPWITELLGGQHPPVAGVAKFTQRQIALYLCGNDPQRAANFERRVWRPSRPVVHLAAANDCHLTATDPLGSHVGVDLSSADLIKKLVQDAAQLQPLIEADDRFGTSVDGQVTLTWIEASVAGF